MKYGEFHKKMANFMLIITVYDWRAVYNGWSAAYTGMVYNVDIREIGDCVIWPFVPILVGDVLLWLLQLVAVYIEKYLRKQRNWRAVQRRSNFSSQTGKEIYEKQKSQIVERMRLQKKRKSMKQAQAVNDWNRMRKEPATPSRKLSQPKQLFAYPNSDSGSEGDIVYHRAKAGLSDDEGK